MSTNYSQSEIDEFYAQVIEYMFDYRRLAYIIFPYGQKDHELEHFEIPHWQLEEWEKMSDHFSNPATRYDIYALAISSGNGARKTSWGAQTVLMMMYTQAFRGRLCSNTETQMRQVIWPEYGFWYQRARYSDYFFDKFGTSITSTDKGKGKGWSLDIFNWHKENPEALSGLHTTKGCTCYIYEEVPKFPKVIFDYAEGAFKDRETMKLWFAFGNSSDPESYFEYILQGGAGWRSRRINTEKLDYIDQKSNQKLLEECGGDRDHDKYRRIVRGLAAKSGENAIFSYEVVYKAIQAGLTASIEPYKDLPTILSIDPAWDGDWTIIWVRRGPYCRMLSRFKLETGASLKFSYNKIKQWAQIYDADAIVIDAGGQGKGIWSFSQDDATNTFDWHTVDFASLALDAPNRAQSEFYNMRAYMYVKAAEFMKTGIITAEDPAWIPLIQKELCITKLLPFGEGEKKMCEPKKDIRDRVGYSPDIADGLIVGFGIYPPTKSNPTEDGVHRLHNEEDFLFQPNSNPTQIWDRFKGELTKSHPSIRVREDN